LINNFVPSAGQWFEIFVSGVGKSVKGDFTIKNYLDLPNGIGLQTRIGPSRLYPDRQSYFLEVPGTSPTNPANVSLSPNSGAAGARIFTTQYTDPNGATNIAEARLLVKNSNTASGTLYGRYWKNLLYLRNDEGLWVGGFAPGSNNVISNKQGSLNCKATTVSSNGTILTINWSFIPAAKWIGMTQTLYMSVIDKSGNSADLKQMGTWYITGGPSTVSLSPGSGSSSSDTPRLFTCQYADPHGATDIAEARFLVNTSNTVVGGLYGRYWNNLLYLRSDDGLSWIGGFAPGSDNVISNRQGSLNCKTTTVNRDPTKPILTITWSFTPVAGWAGDKYLYFYVRDAAGLADGPNGPNRMGEWTIVKPVTEID
jgi:hypothetical protein